MYISITFSAFWIHSQLRLSQSIIWQHITYHIKVSVLQQRRVTSTINVWDTLFCFCQTVHFAGFAAASNNTGLCILVKTIYRYKS